jgi:amino acid permease
MLYTTIFFLSVAVWFVFAALAACMWVRKKSHKFSNWLALFSVGMFIVLTLLHIPEIISKLTEF